MVKKAAVFMVSAMVLLLSAASTLLAAPAEVPRSGQTTSYYSGDDGALQAGVAWPSPRFIVASSGTGSVVTDYLTGLMWAQDTNTPTVDQCSAGTQSWQEALEYVTCLNSITYLGHSDWRVPNITELESLVNVAAPHGGWLFTQGFSSPVGMEFLQSIPGGNYWSSSTYGNDIASAWVVYLDSGGVDLISKTNWASVLPVRDEQSGTISLPKTGQTTVYAAGDDGSLQKGVGWPEPRFTNIDTTTPVNGGVVVDQLTGLIWTQDGNTPGPAACSPGGIKTWYAALDYVICLNTNNYLGYKDWRLPNRKELRSLVNISQPNVSLWLIEQGFSNVSADNYGYWPSSTLAYYAPDAWYIQLSEGNVFTHNKTDQSFYAWPVRGGQCEVCSNSAISTMVLSAPTITYGANGTVVVTVSSPSSAPTGSVMLSVDGGSATSEVLSAVTGSSSSATFTIIKPTLGSHTLSASYAAQNNFDASTASANLTVNARMLTVTATGVNKEYDGGTAATISLSDDRLAGNVFTVEYASAVFADKNAETGKAITISGMYATGAEAANYTITPDSTTATANITARPLTITAEGKTKTARLADPALTYQLTSGSLASGDSISGSLSRATGETTGTYAIEQGTLTAGSNYVITYVGANLTITTATCASQPTGLVSWWKGEGNANDSIGRNTGTMVNGATATGSGKVGQAFSFNGVGYIETSPGVVLGNTFTESVWINPSSTSITDGAFHGFLGYDPSLGSAMRPPGMWVRQDGIAYGFGDGTTQKAAFVYGVLTSGQWQLITTTFDGTNYRLYVNGVEKYNYTGASGTTPVATSIRWIGRVDNYFDGLIDEVQIFNRALTADEIARIYNASSAGVCETLITLPDGAQNQPYSQSVAVSGGAGPYVYSVNTGTLPAGISLDSATGVLSGTPTALGVSSFTIAATDANLYVFLQAYKLQIGTGTCASTSPSGLVGWWKGEGNAIDQVGGHHGTPLGGATYAPGKVGQAFSLDGTNMYIDTGRWSPGSQWTLEAWVKPLTTPSDRHTIIGGLYSFHDWGITMAYGQFGTDIRPPGAGNVWQTLYSGETVVTGIWYHVVGESDGTTARLYVNGQLKNSGPVDPSYIGTTAGTYIGSEACCAGNKFPGLIDEVKIYSRALSAQEITGIYNAGSAGQCGTTSTTTLSAPAISYGANGTVTVTVSSPSVVPTGSVTLSVDGGTATSQVLNAGTGNSSSAIFTITKPTAGSHTLSASYTAQNNVAASTASGALTVNARTLTISADAKTKTAGLADPTLTYTVTSGSLASGDSITGSLTRVAGEAAGTYAIQQGTLTAGSNYTLTYVGANLTITAASCTSQPAGLVSMWKADGNANDSVGGNTGTLVSGATATASGKVGNAFNFDGVDDSVDLAIPNINTAAGTQVTVDFWMYWDGTEGSAGRILISFGMQNLWIQNGGFGLNSGAGDIWGISSAGLGNRWAHITAIFNNGDVKQGSLYVDGVKQTLSQKLGTSSSASLTTAMRISGWKIDGNYPFSGLIDEVQLYNRALTADEISRIYNASSSGVCSTLITLPDGAQNQPYSQSIAVSGGVGPYVYGVSAGSLPAGISMDSATGVLSGTPTVLGVSSFTVAATDANLYVFSQSYKLQVGTGACASPSPPGLIGWWKGDGNAIDQVGGHHGTLQNGATFASGRVGQAFSLNGTNAYINTGAWTAGSQWTIEAWVNPLTAPSGRHTIAGGVLEYHDWGIALENGQFGTVIRPPGTGNVWQTLASGESAVAGTWYHVVGESDGTTARLYVNGQLKKSGPVDPSYIGTSAGTWIGGETCCAGNNFPGLIDEVKIYNRSLTAQEIADIYNAGSAGLCGMTTTMSLSAPAISYGVNGTVTVTVSFPSVAPTGTVTLSVDGGTVSSQVLSAVTGNSSAATFTITKPTAGSHTLSASYADQNNFTASTASGVLTVNARTLTVTSTGVNKEYDGGIDAAVGLTDDRLTGDVFTVGYASAIFADKNAGTGKTITITGMYASGTDAGNYTISPNATTAMANITARPITITVDARTKTAGSADPELTYVITSGSFISGDALTGSLTRVAGETAGTYAIQQGTLTAGNNYEITYVGADLTITGVPSSGTVAAVPQTGQTTVYATGDDGDLKAGVAWPNPRFTVSSSGTGTYAGNAVTDALTGLMWPQDGGTPTIGPCTGGHLGSVYLNWQQALDYVACLNSINYLGYTDWRLPDMNELRSLANYEPSDVAAWLNTQGFVNAQWANYWSSSTFAYNTAYALRVYMHEGRVLPDYKASAAQLVWPVRTGQGGIIVLPKTGQTIVYAPGDDGTRQNGVAWPSPRFMNSDGTAPVSGSVVVDQLTGLIWTQDANAPGPVACLPGVFKTWQSALDYVACLNMNSYLGYRDWRLPDVNELVSLVNASQPNVADWLDVQGFSNVQNRYNVGSQYWSSSTCADDTLRAWGVHLSAGYDGYMNEVDKADSLYVWPVRGGAAGTMAEVAITTAGTGYGTVTTDHGSVIWSGATGTVTVGSQVVVTLTATPDSASMFAGWSGACTGTSTCTLTMDVAKNVTATFDLILPVNGACGLSHGGTFTTAPATNLCSAGTTTGWFGDGPWTWICSGEYGGANANCSANIQTYTVTAGGDSNGTISPLIAVVNHGSTTIFTVTPDAGYHASVTGCNGTLSGNTYTTGAITGDCTVSATFTNSAPGTPTLTAPALASEVATTIPALVVTDQTDPDSDEVQYYFEVYSSPSLILGTLVTSGTTTHTSWLVDVLLVDNTTYYWRAQATDGTANSNWMATASFFVNTENDAPTGLALSAPADNTVVDTVTPVLSVTNAADLDNDVLTYDFDVATDGGFNNIVSSVTGTPQGTVGITSFTTTTRVDNTVYYWRAKARDEHGAYSNEVSAAFFVNTANDAPTTPVISSPSSATEVETLTPNIAVTNSTDLDRDSLSYAFELDKVNTFNSGDKQVSGLLSEGAGNTTWSPATLTDNTTYYWRGRRTTARLTAPGQQAASM